MAGGEAKPEGFEYLEARSVPRPEVG